MRRALPAIAAIAVLAVSGCLGSDDDGDDRRATPDRELLARVSAAIRDSDQGDDVIYVDLTAAREDAGLPDDADVHALRSDEPGGAPLLASIAGWALPYASRPKPTPLSESIDGGRVEAAAGFPLIGDYSVAALRTSQPFDQIASALRRRGYEADSDGVVLVSGRGFARVVYPVVANAGGGVVVLAGSVDVARRALAGRAADLTRASELIAEVSGVGRAANANPGDCVLARAAGEGISPHEGEYMVVVKGTAEAGKLRLKDITGGSFDLTWGAATADGDRVRAKFQAGDVLNAHFGGLVQAFDEVGPRYDC